MDKNNKTSVVLGILALLIGVFIPIVGIILGFAGILVSDDCNKCLLVNALAVLASVVFWAFIWTPMWL